MSYAIAICLKMLEITTHSIHVWYIYLHLLDFCGKCIQIYHTWILWAIDNSYVYSVYCFVHRSDPLKCKLGTGKIVW